MTSPTAQKTRETTRKWPETLHGWKTLFWLAVHRCPIHHCQMHIDGTIYDMGGPAYCFKCEGVGIWPRSADDALRQNARSAAKAEGRAP